MTPRAHPAAAALRVCAAGALAWFVAPAIASAGLPVTVSAAVVIALTIWSPIAGLVATVALAPAGLLVAPPPVRAAEVLVWSFVGTWLAAVWRPLAQGRVASVVHMPAILYASCAVASWLAYTVADAGGIEPLFLPLTVARAISPEHLLYSSPEPETFTLLPLLAGLALFGAAAAITALRPSARLAMAAALAASAALLSVLTIAEVVRGWSTMDYGWWFLLRYTRGERYSLHLADLNAAGSHYVLGALAAVTLAVVDRRRRFLWTAISIAVAPALWISGSRSASLGGLIVGASLIPLVRRGATVRVGAARLAVALVLLVAAVLVGAVAATGPAEQGSATNALHLRAHFLITSARMFASAPFSGVGIGRYHERSNEFMTPTLRDVYGHENAHNFFAQQFAELGIAGGLVFVWLVVAVLLVGWRHVRATTDDGAALALLAGSGGYLLTCITGHPLLVPEAAIPFWGAFGAVAGLAAMPAVRSSAAIKNPKLLRAAAIATLIVIAVNLVIHVRRYTLASTQPNERGFYAVERSADGNFVWMTRHGVFYVGPQPGTVIIPVRAPDFPDGRRYEIAVEVAGRRVGVYEAVPDRWTTIEIPLRRPAAGAYRRIDLRANRSWSPMRDRGDREDDLPRSVMIGETQWRPAGAR